VSETAITRRSLKRVRGRVPEVQYLARACVCARQLFSLVAPDNPGLEGALRGDQLRERILRLLLKKKAVGLIEELAAPGSALLDGFAPSGRELSVR
jgi:hypothetical protein